MTDESMEATRGHLVRSASLITPLTLLSRLTGYLREKVIAFTLGAGMRSDAFFVAFRIPNMLREIIGEGAMSSAVIPVYTEVSARSSEEQARAFVGRVAATFSMILAAITVAGIAASPWLVDLLAGQFRETPGKLTTASITGADSFAATRISRSPTVERILLKLPAGSAATTPFTFLSCARISCARG